MKPNETDLARVRRHPQRTKLYLGIYEPETAFAAQVNDATIAQGAITITYDNVTSGLYTSIKEGMTLYVGSYQGGKDLGRVRVRSATSSALTIAENDHIQWKDDVFLTVVRFFEPWGVYSRIVLDDDNIPTFYKDYDLVYSDQNEQFQPVVNMGPHVARFRETGTASIFYSMSGSFDPTDGSSPTGSEWWFEGGTPTGSPENHPGLIAYQQSGHFTTHLQVTSNYGKTFEGHRHVMIFDRPGFGVNPPIMNFGFIGLEGNRKGGGYSGRFWIREPADFDKVVDGALVILFTEDWYGTEKVSIGGDALDRSNLLFVGYIEDESIRYNSFTSRLEFRVRSVTGIADLRETFSATLENKTDAVTWNEMTNMTIDKAVVSYLRWQSTLLSIADFHWTGDTKAVQFADFGRGTIFAEVQKLYENALGAEFVADRQGTMWAEIDVNLQTTGSRALTTYPELMELTRADWLDEINFSREPMEKVSYIEAGGIAYSGAVTGTFDPYLSGAPGEAPAYAGGVMRRSGLVLLGQNQLNQFTGLDYAQLNSIYPRIDVTFGGDFRFVDIAPQEFILLTVAQSDTYRGIIWDRKRFIPQSISYEYDSREEVLLYRAILKEETSGPPGVTVVIPVEPPYDQPDLPDFSIEFPPIQPYPPLLPPTQVPQGIGDLVYLVTTNRLTRTRNMSAPGTGTIWVDLTPTFAADGVTGTFTQFLLDPFDPLNVGYLMTQAGTTLKDQGPFLYRITNLNAAAGSQVYTELMNPQLLNSLISASTNQRGHSFTISPINNNIIEFSASGHIPLPGPNQPRARPLRSVNRGASWFDITGDMDQQPGGDAESKVFDSEHSIVQIWLALGNASGAGAIDFWFTNNVGAHWSNPLGTDSVQGYHVPFQGNGSDLIFYWSNDQGALKTLYRSDDRGSTKVDISPRFDGDTWAKKRSGNSVGRISEQVLSHQSNRLFMAAMLQRAVVEPTDGNDSCYFTATDGAQQFSSWLPRRVFNGHVGWMAWHKTNVNTLYALGNQDNERILVTFDGGLTWEDKQASWERDIGTIGPPDTLGWDRVGIFPVWTV